VKRPSLVLAGAVVLCLPMVPAFLAGTIAPFAALERFLLALIVSWIAASVISSVTTRYSNQARQAEIVRQLTEARRASSEPVQPDRVIPPR
jgi:hypothetical protein